MAGSALAEASAFSMATDIKQEHESTGLECLDFTLPPELASKRPFEEDDGATTQVSEAKRAKTETETEEAALEDGLALLVQNALSNVGDLVDQFTSGHESAPELPVSDAMEVDTTIPPPEAPVVRATFVSDPQKFIRDANIHALGNLALSLLLILVQPPFEDTLKLVRGSDSQHKQTFRKLKYSFENVYELYSSGPALSANQLEFRDSDSRTFVELANLAQLGLWLVDGTPKALSEADENFLAMLQCQLSELPPGMTELYLGIKTQRAIEFLAEKEPEKPSYEVIGEVLTEGLEDTLKEQHCGGELTSADQSFVSSVQSRKETLQAEVKEELEPAALREKHPAEDLLRSFLEYATGRLKSLTDIGNKLGLGIEISDSESYPEPILEATGDADLDLDDLSSFFEKTTSGLVQNALAGLTDELATTTSTTEEGGEAAAQSASTETKTEASPAQTNGKIDLMTDYKELEALVAESTSNYVKTTLNGLSPVPYQPTVPASTTESMAAQLPYLAQAQHHQPQHAYYPYAQPPPEPQQPPAPGENLPPNQTFPSSVLYDKARQAALSKSSAHTRREGLHSTRRPWTQEEEKALMAGLDMVKGPHWSQILTLFGQNGTISDILKDRTQVQLKDKARNLKLFFLKTNSEMPYYLQAVTGELKTRAPTQAARKEAEERARLNSEEDQAKLQGIMALAGGLQHPPHGRTPASPASAVGSGVVTPAQAAQAASASTQQHHVGHQANAAGQGAQATSGPRPMATSAPQTRPGGQTTSTQQLLHSVAQANARPQAQLPPQVPRPQGQPQHHQPGHQPQPQPQPQQTQPAPSAQQPTQTSVTPATPQPTTNIQAQAATASIPNSMPLAAAPPQSTTSPVQTHSPQLSPPAAQPVAQPQSAPTPSPAPQQHPSPPQEAPKPDSPTQQEQDNAAEAALLEGLQAVVAQSLAS